MFLLEKRKKKKKKGIIDKLCERANRRLAASQLSGPGKWCKCDANVLLYEEEAVTTSDVCR